MDSVTDCEKAPLFSAVIVTCNDLRRLKECLASLSFCSEIVVVDLGSVDGSVELARSFGAKVHRHERVPIVEMIRETSFAYASNDWIVHIDPDEVFPSRRVPEITELAKSPELAIVRLPWAFYFKGKPLKGTVWGGNNSRPAVYHRGRIDFCTEVHVAPRAKAGFGEEFLQDRENGCIVHYWMDSFSQLLEKHLRYLRQEGKAKYLANERFSYRLCIFETLRALYRCLIRSRGWSDGVTGIFLSLFYAWYVMMSYFSLQRFQRQLSRNMSTDEIS